MAAGLLPLGLGLDEVIASNTTKHSLRLVYKPYQIDLDFSHIPHFLDSSWSWTTFGSATLTAAELVESAVHHLGLPRTVNAGGQQVQVDYQLRTKGDGEGKPSTYPDLGFV